MKACFIGLLFISAFHCYGQTTGTINGFYGGKIKIIQTVQAVTPSGYDVIAETNISEDGRFQFRQEPYPGYYYLKIENRYIPFYFDPECNGEIKLTAPDNLDNKMIPVKIEYPCSSGSEYRYFHEIRNDFENKTADFIQQNPMPRRDTAFAEKMERFEGEVFDRYTHLDKFPYLVDKVNYQIASIKKQARFPNDELFDEYLKQTPVKFNHSDYLTFFIQFYQSKIMKHIRMNKDDYVDSLIVYSGFKAVSNLFMKAEYIDERDKAELAVLAFLYKGELPHVKQERKRILLEQAVLDAQSPKIKRAANDILNKMDFLKKGSKPPAFQITDADGETVTEKDLSGSFTYLQFWNTWNDAAVQDFMYIKELREKYPNIKFVSISTDRDREAFLNFVSQHEFDRLVAHYDNKYSVLEKYGVETTPMYFLIDKQGKFLMSPAKEPSKMHGIFRALNDIDKKKRKPYEIIRDYED